MKVKKVKKVEATHGAFFLAKVVTESFSKASAKTGVTIAPWDKLTSDERKTLALGIQYLIDLRIIEPISYTGLLILKRHEWESAKGKKGTKV